MQLPRSSGILLPVFSLPDSPGVGDLGPAACRFVDFLQSAGQTIWQLLPLGPPAKGDSPYSSYSAFAGNPLLISCEELVTDGLLTAQQLADAGHNELAGETADYEAARAIRKPLLRTAYVSFQSSANVALQKSFTEFCEHSRYWLDDFARFDAMVADLGTPDWSEWPSDLVHREASAIEAVDERLRDEIDFAKFEQFVFARQWAKLKAYANSHNVRIYGDMPIFVAYESVDVWVHQGLFCLNESGRPLVVAGVPPDYFSSTGQKWGNPLYDWAALASTNYEWWTRRFQQAFEHFDLLRIDHFRGFESYWEIPVDAPNEIGGEWKAGPQEAPFTAAQEALGKLPIIAEDLGLITEEVHRLRDQLGFPGMRVLQFGFDDEHDDYHRPCAYPAHCVAYTGTHDNDTAVGWYRHREADGLTNELLKRFLSDEAGPVHWQLVRLVLDSPADTAIIPMQDLLGLGSEARINTPGMPDGNWVWRCPSMFDSVSLAAELRSYTEAARR